MTAGTDRLPIRQTNMMEPCPGTLPDGSPCGSVYRRGDCCNVCETFAPERAVQETDDHAGRKSRTFGRIWDSSLHRYVGIKYD